MLKNGKKGRKRQGYLCMSDITLHDFADCPRPQACGRVKKSVAMATAGAIVKTAITQTALNRADDDLSWFEKDLDSFVIEDETTEDDEDPNSINSRASVSGKSQKGQEKTNSSHGIVYPQDLWFLVSDYIHPEDVGRFSGICRGAYSVTLTAAFWRRLYERFLTDQRKSAQTAEKQMKRKILYEEVQSLKKKRIAAEDDARQLNIEDDRLSLKAQEQRCFTLLVVHANTPRRSSKDKQNQVQSLTSKLYEKEE